MLQSCMVNINCPVYVKSSYSESAAVWLRRRIEVEVVPSFLPTLPAPYTSRGSMMVSSPCSQALLFSVVSLLAQLLPETWVVR